MSRLFADTRECQPEMAALSADRVALVDQFLGTVWTPLEMAGQLPKDLPALSDDRKRLEAFKFLTVRNWDLEKAKELFVKAAEKRTGRSLDGPCFPSAFPIFGYDQDEVRAALGQTEPRQAGYVDKAWNAMAPVYAGAVCGRDKQGRPVVIERTGQTQVHGFVKNLKAVAPVGKDASDGAYELRLHVNEVMQRLQRFNDATVGQQQGRAVTGCAYIFDLAGLGMQHIYTPAVDVLMRCYKADAIFPEGVEKIYVVNTPAFLNVLLSIVQPDQRNKDKMVVLSADQTKEALLKDIDAQFLPVELGGEAEGAFPPQPASAHDPADAGSLTEHIDVAAGSAETKIVEVAEGDVVVWEFAVEGEYDIECKAVFAAADGTETEVAAVERKLHGNGEYTAEAAGKLAVVFGNEYSWMRGKTVAARVYKK